MKNFYAMKMFKHLMVVALALFAFNALAENKIWIDDFEINPGDEKTLDLKGTFDESVAGIQLDIIFPEGLEIQTIRTKNPKYLLPNDDIDPGWTWKYSSPADIAPYGRRFMGYGDIETYVDQSDSGCQFFQIKVKASDTYDNAQKLTIKQAKFSTRPGTTMACPDVVVATEVVETIATEKAVKGVKYYNLLGVESAEPFAGVNVVVTEFEDGSKTAAKVVK